MYCQNPDIHKTQVNKQLACVNINAWDICRGPKWSWILWKAVWISRNFPHGERRHKNFQPFSTTRKGNLWLNKMEINFYNIPHDRTSEKSVKKWKVLVMLTCSGLCILVGISLSVPLKSLQISRSGKSIKSL